MKSMAIGWAAASCVALLATAGHATAANPTITYLKIDGVQNLTSFEEYADKATTVGKGRVDIDKLFFIDENEVDGVKSWYIFFDPSCHGTVDAKISFSDTILGVKTTKHELRATQALYGNDDFTYRTVKHTGLERRDSFEVIYGNTLEIHWKAGDPGDHIRVLTAVPEPQSYALLLAGLGLVGAMARRRSKSLR